MCVRQVPGVEKYPGGLGTIAEGGGKDCDRRLEA